jgi:hypothetical protein
MTFDDLLDFVNNRMRMAHVYQPLVLEFLAESGGTATIRQLAVAMAASDEAAIEWFARKIAEMPVPVLENHGVVSVDGSLVGLTTERLTYEQRAKLVAACEARIAQFLAERGTGVWSGLVESLPVPESIRYQVLARDRKCVLCGAGPETVQLQVDHITPKSRGGSNDLTNLQVLCATCNRGKSNRDDTNFTDPAEISPDL